jgi:anti-anti-sigma regulatory factor/anti-sigma regulatory factor (Ser/Thr protein kinase)
MKVDVVVADGLAVVRAQGALSLSTAPVLRGAVLKCLADRPRAILVDARALTAVDDAALTVFAAVASHAAAWPSVPVLVCAAPADLTAALRRLGIDRYLTLCAGVGQGRVLARAHGLPRQVRDRLPAVPDSVTVARDLARDACRRWGHPEAADTCAVLVTELVGNAVRHGTVAPTDPIRVVLTCQPRYLHVAVQDTSARPPRCTGPDGEGEPGGRGLLIVDALATRWGYTPLPVGKVTWASLSTAR